MISRRIALLSLAVLLGAGVSSCANNSRDTALLPRPLVVATIGASDAVGIGATDAARGGWPMQLVRRLPEGTRLINLGISGAKASDALEQEAPVARDADPDVVVIWLAVNDLRDNVPLATYEATLSALVQKVSETGRARVAIANVPDLTTLPALKGIPRDRLAREIVAWNDAIQRVAIRHGATLVDLTADWSELADRPDFIAKDGFHPSDAGHQRLAEIFYTVIRDNGWTEPTPR